MNRKIYKSFLMLIVLSLVNLMIPLYAYADSYMKIGEAGINLIKSFEGCELTAYQLSGEKYYTIGYGHYGADVYAGMKISQEQADQYLVQDLGKAEGQVNSFLNRNGISVNQNQFDALVSFTFNLGDVWTSTPTFQLKTYLMNGVANYSPAQITTAFTNWNKDSNLKPLDGLTRRRNAEASLFLNGTIPQPDECTCSDSYAGSYKVTTTQYPLTIRNGHGTNYSAIGSIPSGEAVMVTKANGTWAHVIYNGLSGFCSMEYLTPVSSDAVSCNCSESCAGFYKVITTQYPLTIRDGHGTNFTAIGEIPKDETVYIEKGDGAWAHVTHNGISGYSSMEYLMKLGNAPSGYSISVSPTTAYNCEQIAIVVTPFEGETVTDYILHIVYPSGETKDSDRGDNNKAGFWPRISGTYKIYAEVKNEYGTYCGSETNGCIEISISTPDMGSFVDIGDDFDAYLIHKSSGNVLTSDGDNVSSKKRVSTDNQKWHFSKKADGSYEIYSLDGDGKYLDEYSGRGRQGDNVQVYKAEGEFIQSWYIYSAGENSYYIKPACSDSAVLNVYGNSMESGANVQIWTYNETDAQIFQIEKIGAECKHQYVAAIASEPTFTKEGCIKYTCSICGDSYTETIPCLEFVEGDCNCDGTLGVADIVMLQKWLLNDGTELMNWKAVDLYEDEVIDVFDLCMMKRLLLQKKL